MIFCRVLDVNNDSFSLSSPRFMTLFGLFHAGDQLYSSRHVTRERQTINEAMQFYQVYLLNTQLYLSESMEKEVVYTTVAGSFEDTWWHELCMNSVAKNIVGWESKNQFFALVNTRKSPFLFEVRTSDTFFNSCKLSDFAQEKCCTSHTILKSIVNKRIHTFSSVNEWLCTKCHGKLY